MAAENDKRILLPGPLDDFTKGLSDAFNTAGTIIVESSPKSAQNRLVAAAERGVGPTESYPWYFDIGGNVYRATGQKSSAGKFKLTPINQAEYKEDNYLVDWSGQKEFTVGEGGKVTTSVMMKSSLPVQQYDRRVRAEAFAWGYRKSGWVTFRLYGHDGAIVGADFGTSDAKSVSVSLSCVIKAGEEPNIRAAIVGDGTVVLASAKIENRLMVSADPITMA